MDAKEKINHKSTAEVPTAVKNLSDGDHFFKARNFKSALDCYQKAIDSEPANLKAWMGKSQTLVMSLKYPEAVESCKNTLDIDPKNASLWFLRSFSHGMLGEYQDALDSCTRGLELDPSNKMVWCTRGQYLYALGRLEEALESFGTALKMSPDNEYFQEVQQKVKKWLQRDGKSDAFANTVMTFLQQGGYKEALDTYQQSLKLDPRQVTKPLEKDFALAHLENPEKILQEHEKTKLLEQPKIALELSQKEFEFSRETWVEVILSNKGKSVARDISFRFSADVVMKQLDVSPELLQSKTDKPVNLDIIPELAPGNQVKKLVSLMPTKLGQLSLEAQIAYTDAWHKRQNKTAVVWVSVFKPNEQMPAIPNHKMMWRLNTSESAQIYIAQRASDSIRVVVKIFQFDSEQTGLLTEFMNEIKQCCKLIHPNIVRIFQFGDKPSPWITLEYMSKGALSRRIGRLSIAESLHIGIKLTDALSFARTLHLTHRCITPDNVLFDAKDIPKLNNWRIGSITPKLHKNNSLLEMVNAYYPPEKVRSGLGGSDQLSDIYQLGVLLYEMLTGRPPFTGSGAELINKIENEAPEPPGKLNSNITPELDNLVLCCLSKNKKDRYQFPLNLRKELENVAVTYKQGLPANPGNRPVPVG